ncbi:MAG: hypothetical protein PUF12_06495 [Thermoflexaceae bacterium]|nr:hypothetical protein [Thermoflexaceae bacterium]
MSENNEEKSEQIQNEEEFVFDEKPVQPKWFKNKVINIIFIIGVIILLCLAVFFVRKVWPDVVEYFKEKRLYQQAVKEDHGNDIILHRDHFNTVKEDLAGHAVYFELIGPVGLVCVLIFICNYLRQLAAKKMQDARRKKKEKKFYKEKQRKEQKEAIGEAKK